MNNSDPARSHGGGPRRRGPAADPTVRTRVLNAFLQLVGERGLANTPIDDIAQEAGVSKVTLYKRWPTRYDLILDGFNMLDTAPADITAGMSAREIFDRFFARTENAADHRARRQLLAELTAAAGYDENARNMLHARQAGWREFVRAFVEHGKATGEFPSDRDTNLAADMIVGVTTAAFLHDDIATADLIEWCWHLLTDERPF